MPRLIRPKFTPPSRLKLTLSATTANQMLHYDGRTGALTWRVDRGRGIKAGDEAGTIRPDDGRIAVTVNGRTYMAHRIIWLMVHGVWPKRLRFVDGDPMNLRLSNLVEQEEVYSTSYHATYQRQHRQKRRRAIQAGLLDADR